MAIKLYMDQHVPRAISTGLRLRRVEVLTAYEDNASTLSDQALLDRAGALRRMLFTRDDDLLVEAARRQSEGITFFGVIYAHQLKVPIGICIHDLELIANIADEKDIVNLVMFLPL